MNSFLCVPDRINQYYSVFIDEKGGIVQKPTDERWEMVFTMFERMSYSKDILNEALEEMNKDKLIS